MKETNDSALIDEAALQELQALMGDKFKTLLTRYMQTADNCAQELSDALERRDITKIMISAHSLKSSSDYLGLKAVAAQADFLEKWAVSIEENKEENSGAAFKELATRCHQLQAAIQQARPLLQRYTSPA